MKSAADPSTPEQTQNRNTVIFVGLESGGYTGKFEEFGELKGVVKSELELAHLEVGKAIGFYRDENLDMGEAKGTEESP
jgi:hypothetical protein